jgi:hypothetical protein
VDVEVDVVVLVYELGVLCIYKQSSAAVTYADTSVVYISMKPTAVRV